MDRVAMAKSGALLLLFRDPDGTLDRARRALRGAFPGGALEADRHRALHAPEGVSEGKRRRTNRRRLVVVVRRGAEREGAGGRERVARGGRHRLAGARVKVSRAWLVREERFVRGRPAVVFPPVTSGRLTATTFRSAGSVEL